MVRPLVLASTSPYRAALLRRLVPDFIQDRPEVEETPLPDEHPEALCRRLAIAKADTLAHRYPSHRIIGSDQVADFNGETLGKPGNHAAAVRQLSRFSGQEVRFHTAVALIEPAAARLDVRLQTTRVLFRELSPAAIEHYLQREQPYDCAGSFKCEGLGIALFQKIDSDDPTALIGLPLIALTDLLGHETLLGP